MPEPSEKPDNATVPLRRQRGHWALLAAMVLLGALCSVAGFLELSALRSLEQENAFQKAADAGTAAMQRELSRIEDNLIAISALFAASQFVDQREFEDFVARVHSTDGMVQAMAYMPMKQPTGATTLAIDDDVALAAPSAYLVGNRLAWLDLNSGSAPDTVLGQSLARVLERGTPTMLSAPPSVRKRVGATRFLFAQSVTSAVHEPAGDPLQTGLALVEFDLQLLMDDVVAAAPAEFGLTLELAQAGLDTGGAPQLHQSVADTSGDRSRSNARPKALRTISIAGQKWIAAFSATSVYPGAGGLAWLCLAGGLLVTAAFSYTIHRKLRHGERVSQLVADRTADLRRARDEARDTAERLSSTVEKLSHAESDLRQRTEQKQQLLGAIRSLLIGVDTDFRVTEWNRTAVALFGQSREQALHFTLSDMDIDWDSAKLQEAVVTCFSTACAVEIDDLELRTGADEQRTIGATVTPALALDGTINGALIIGADVTERIAAADEKRNMEVQLRQAQKLESIGQLAAGIAHEINTPTQFVGDNTRFLQDGFGDLLELERAYAKLVESARQDLDPGLVSEIDAAAKKADRDYLAEEIPRAIEQSLEGIDRIAHIVRAMKEFSHPGGGNREFVDVNRSIVNAVTVAANEWKYVAEVSYDLDEELAPVPCFPQEFNQVILNLVVNAAHAIADAAGDNTGQRGVISISSGLAEDMLEVRIADTGTGIPESLRERIFDPFFTTKEVGKGTGQGLALAHAAIVERHGGSIHFETETGKGTVFIIRIPKTEPEMQPEEAVA